LENLALIRRTVNSVDGLAEAREGKRMPSSVHLSYRYDAKGLRVLLGPAICLDSHARAVKFELSQQERIVPLQESTTKVWGRLPESAISLPPGARSHDLRLP